MLTAAIAAANVNTAQLMFLIALIVGVIAFLFAALPVGRPYAWASPVLVLLALIFISAGLLFAF